MRTSAHLLHRGSGLSGVGKADDGRVGERLAAIRERIAVACSTAGRSVNEVVLLGASKRQAIERLEAAYAAGLRDFGENRVQEGGLKKPELPADIQWHLIGPLQSNKAKSAVELFDVVHSVDRPKIIRALDREAERIGRVVPCFLEVNLGDEPSKHGFSPGAVTDGFDQLLTAPHLEPIGLMAIPPPADSAEGSRPWFRRLRELRDGLLERHAGFAGGLSMGMSGDFEVAIEEGATHVRVGTALFGPRPPL